MTYKINNVLNGITKAINTPSIENLISQYQNGELDSNLRGNSSQSYLVDDNNILL